MFVFLKTALIFTPFAAYISAAAADSVAGDGVIERAFDAAPGWSSTGILALAIVLILRGWLVPRRTLQDAQDEAAAWRRLFENEQETRAGTLKLLQGIIIAQQKQSEKIEEVKKVAEDISASAQGGQNAGNSEN